LLQHILPEFEKQLDVTVEVIAVGTGQAIALGKSGDADVLLVHAPDVESSFIAEGHGTDRQNVMYNDFIIVGPKHDPASIQGVSSAAEAMMTIFESNEPWASRGDESGTHMKENALWAVAGIEPLASDKWYFSLGQGMGATLQYSNETDSYTLTDRATYLTQSDMLPFLDIMVGGQSISYNPDHNLYNPYSIIPVNPSKSVLVNHKLSLQFVDWFLSAETQNRIGNFRLSQLGQPIFYPFVR
tara:strand:+ start:1483 stop:2208 length:726 start_codon:yes stop_codon:yes gene_type:complete